MDDEPFVLPAADGFLDGAFRLLPDRAWIKVANALLLVIAAAFIAPLCIHVSHIRLTNVDQTAKVIAQRAQADDLVVVDNFLYALSVQRYYHGAAPLLPVPVIDDLSLHRWDLLKACMMQPAPIRSILTRIDQTLQSGHTVYIVGLLIKNEETTFPPDLPRAPAGPTQWAFSSYLIRWTQQIAYVSQTHATKMFVLHLPCDQPLSEGENVHAIVLSGWKPATVAAQ
jgi:hypothetical protein